MIMYGILLIEWRQLLAVRRVDALSRSTFFLSKNIIKSIHTDNTIMNKRFIKSQHIHQHPAYSATIRNAHFTRFYLSADSQNNAHNGTTSTSKDIDESLKQKQQQIQDTIKKIQEKQLPPLPNFCSNCGSSNMILSQPSEHDEKVRAICQDCKTVVYTNPKIVVSCVIVTSCKKYIILAKRNIMPQKSKWGIPQGYMELYESTRDAIIREVYEEIGLSIITDNKDQLQLRAIYTIPGSIQIVYEISCFTQSILQQHVKEINNMITNYHSSPSSSMEDGSTSLSTTTNNIKSIVEETEEIQLFAIDMVPYDDICFPTVQWAINHCLSSESSSIQYRSKLYDPDQQQWITIDND